MPRRYTITVTVEATFDRAIKARKARTEVEKAVSKAVKGPWAVKASAIKQRKFERLDIFQMLAAPAGKEYDRLERQADRLDEQQAAAAERDQKQEALDRVRSIYKEIKDSGVRAPTTSIRWLSKGCGRERRGPVAHAHVMPGNKENKNNPWFSGGRWVETGGFLKGNLVCLMDAAWTRYYTESDEWVAGVVAHELAHIGLPPRHRHTNKRFVRRYKKFMRGWCAARGIAGPVWMDEAAAAPELPDDDLVEESE